MPTNDKICLLTFRDISLTSWSFWRSYKIPGPWTIHKLIWYPVKGAFSYWFTPNSSLDQIYDELRWLCGCLHKRIALKFLANPSLHTILGVFFHLNCFFLGHTEQNENDNLGGRKWLYAINDLSCENIVPQLPYSLILEDVSCWRK